MATTATLARASAEIMSNNQMVAGLIEEMITVNQMFDVLPFVQVHGKAYLYHREAELATVDFLDPDETITPNAGRYLELVTKLRILAGDVDVDNFLNETMSDTNNQLAVAMSLKAKAMAQTFQKAVIQGDSTAAPKSFDGIKAMATNTVAGQPANAAQTITTVAGNATGAAITFAKLDELVDLIPNKPDFLVMNSAVRRNYMVALRALGGNAGAMIQHPNFGMPVLAHNGVPILLNDWLPTETQGSSTTCSSVYAVRANEADGLHGLYGGADAGMRVESLGLVQNKDSTRTRVKWYCGLALKSTKSLGRLTGVLN